MRHRPCILTTEIALLYPKRVFDLPFYRIAMSEGRTLKTNIPEKQRHDSQVPRAEKALL